MFYTQSTSTVISGWYKNGYFFTTGSDAGNHYAIVKLTLRCVPEQKVLKTWYTCSARSRTGSTTTALTSRLTTRFRVCIGREKQKHCTPVQPTLGPVAPPLHYSPDSQYAPESVSTEKEKKTLYTCSAMSQRGSTTTALIACFRDCINRERKKDCTHVQPSLREEAPLLHSSPDSQHASESALTEREKQKDNLHLFR